MLIIDSVSQPTPRTTAQAIDAILRNAPPEEIDIAAAYITSGGLCDLLKVIRDCLGAQHIAVHKRWLTSFDYCRTEPVALEGILSLENSLVRVFDAEFCISRGCTPRTPFHPKTLFFRNAQFDFVLAGSGNVSRSGLSRGVEAGLSVGIDRTAVAVEPTANQSIALSRGWFESVWNGAVSLTPDILAQYASIYESIENRKAPTPTEDDTASSDTSRGSLNSDDLQRLRVCRNFWIEAGNITKNRGPGLPGNQLMMKRLSRVFFGFPPTSLPQNSPIGTVEISYNGAPFNPYSITYSDNGMDKLVLPMPGQEGPQSYDGRNLLFVNVRPGAFRLILGSNRDKKMWLGRSKQVNGTFKMTSGRQWGVF